MLSGLDRAYAPRDGQRRSNQAMAWYPVRRRSPRAEAGAGVVGRGEADGSSTVHAPSPPSAPPRSLSVHLRFRRLLQLLLPVPAIRVRETWREEGEDQPEALHLRDVEALFEGEEEGK